MRYKVYEGRPVKAQKQFCHHGANGRTEKKIRITFYEKDPSDPTGQANQKLVVSEEDWVKNARDVFSDRRRSDVVRGSLVEGVLVYDDDISSQHATEQRAGNPACEPAREVAH